MDRVRYVPNRRSVGGWLRSGEVAELVRRAAERGRQAAAQMAPRDTGAYVSGLQVTTRVHGDRQTALLEATARHSAAVEVRDRVLARSVDAIRP